MMEGRGKHLAGAGLILASLVAAQPAGAEVTVEMSGTTAVISPTGTSNTRFRLEHFADDTRNGIRVRQIFVGDPSISSMDPDCDHNPVVNDVVCVPFPTSVQIDTTTGNDMVQIGGSNVTCQTTQGTPVDIDLKAGNDQLNPSGACQGTFIVQARLTARYVQARGGPGNDSIVADLFNDVVNGDGNDDFVLGLEGADTLNGGTGADELNGGPHSDTIRGGDGGDVLEGDAGQLSSTPEGADTLEGGSGGDTLRGDGNTDTLRGQGDGDILSGGDAGDNLDGGTGADSVNGGSGADVMFNDDGSSPDTLDGGTGIDLLSYATSLGAPVGVTLDGVANDGAAGEGDNVLRVEKVIGTPGADDLTGSIANETLEGRIGNDEIDGEGGEDTLSGGDDDDRIDSRDGVAEFVRCGSGFDSVTADLEDDFPAPRSLGPSIGGPTGECEDVEEFAVDDGPPARILNRSVRIRRNRSIRLRLRCPRRARVSCRGRLRLTHAGVPRRTLDSARYRIRRGRTRTVRLKLSRRAAARARKRRALVARTRERGASKKGPRGTVRWLRVHRRR